MKSIIRTHFFMIYRASVCVLFLMVLFFTRLETARIAPVAVTIVLLLSAGLIFLPRVRLLTLPFFLLCLLLVFCYDSYSVFIRYLWLLPVVAAALVIHLVRLRPKFLRGAGFFPLLAVALATTLGGVGVLTPGEYFAPISLFYVCGLGVGLVLLYLVFKNEMRDEAESAELLADIAALALTTAAVMLGYRLLHLREALELGTLTELQGGNNIATMLLLSFPALFRYTKKHIVFLPLGMLTVLATMLSGSRGGFLFAPILLFFCLLWLWLTEERPVVRLWLRLFVYLCGATVFSAFLLYVCNCTEINLSSEYDSRPRLLVRSISDFRESPIFGKGLAYQGNNDLYHSKQGAINWFHMFFPQIIGSMGLCGILAWGWQLYTRARLSWARWAHPDFAFALCYLGLFLMSQVNPGEFCPIPYALEAVLFMVVLENGTESTALKYNEKRRRKGETEKTAKAAE